MNGPHKNFCPLTLGLGLPVWQLLISPPAQAASWATSGPLNTPRERGTAALLPNGKLLFAGGATNNTAELYDPATGLSSLTGRADERG